MSARILHIVARLCCLIALLPAACSLGSAINRSVFDYFEVNDLASNQIILLNILYAKDGAPLHFSELSQIRGQLTVGATASTTFPFGPITHATTAPRALATLSATVSSAPSFDISSLDTKDFTIGVMTPISPESVTFFLNEGVDYRMVLMLLASGIRPAGSPEMLLNAPNGSRKVCVETPHVAGSNDMMSAYRIVAAGEACASELPEFYGFLDVLNHLSRVYPVTVARPPKAVGPPFTLQMGANLRAVTGIDPAKYMLRRLPSGQYQLMTVSRGTMVVLCEENPAGPQVVSVLGGSADTPTRVDRNACTKRQSADDEEDAAAPPSPGDTLTIGVSSGTYALQLRSTLEVIQYVGQVLAFQAAQTALYPDRPERCVTLQFVDYEHGQPTCGGAVLMHLLTSDALLPSSGVSVTYDGRNWMLPPPRSCPNSESCDYSLQTLSIISLLLNQNKSAKEIAATPAVQVVP